jgi:Tol biopolymer transport system component
MEYLDGEPLSALLARGPLPLPVARRYAMQMIDALAAAHEGGVVHRDFKPANVMVTPGGVKLLDFGIAKMRRLDADHEDVGGGDPGTRLGTVIGTAGYMSPEQARGQSVDARTDIWAFGCVLYEMLSGRAAFAGDTGSDALVAVLEREPAWHGLAPGTPASIERLLRRCLQKDAARRLRDIADARADLEDTDATPMMRAVRGPRVRWSRVIPWAIAASVLALAGAMVTWPRPQSPAAAPLRLSIVPPEGTTWAPFDISGAPQFALSPDGRQIVLVVADASHVPRLWLRSLDSTNARALIGTDQASGPFWSPDGSSLAYFADRKLKRLTLRSGAVQEIAEVAPNVAGGTWSAAGTILFAGPGTGLLRVSQDGGPVTPVSATSPRTGEISLSWPQFLPDGRRFLFYVRNRDRAASGTYLGSLDSAERRLVLRSSARAVYAPTGHLLFEQAGSLMAMPFDEATGTPIGPAVAWPDRVVALPVPAWLPVSAAAGAVGYWSGDGRPTFALDVVDRAGRLQQHVLPAGQYLGLDLSRDGTRALVTERIDAQNDTLSMIDLATGVRTRVTLTPGVAHFGVWSPDSREVIYGAIERGTSRLARRVVPGNNVEVAVLPSRELPNLLPTDWSGDGEWVLYSSPATMAWDVFALRLRDGVVRPVIEAPLNQIQARLSPDGRWIAYASDDAGRFDVYVQAFADGSGRTLVSTRGGSQPSWRHDGRELFYLASDGTYMAVPVTAGPRFEPGPEAALFRTPRQDVLAPFAASHAVSADGRSFLIRPEVVSAAYRTITVVAEGAGLRTR